jgi:hypothetical protein
MFEEEAGLSTILDPAALGPAPAKATALLP